MSAYHQIFIRSDKSAHDLVRELGTAAGTEIEAIRPPIGPISHRGRVDDSIVEIELHHEFDQDRHMDFHAYPWLVTIRNLHNDKAEEEVLARSLFHGLGDIGGYDLLLVFDLQRLLARS